MALLRFHLPVLCLMICSCSSTTTEPIEPKQEVIPDQLVGRIATIYPEAGYMLIQKYRTIKRSDNTVFYSRNEQGQTHSISLNEQTLGQFYVADIKGSHFTINDPIFQRTLEDTLQADVNQLDTETLENSP